MSTELTTVHRPPSTDLVRAAHVGQAANTAAARHVFSGYQQRRPPQTLRRQRADLQLFASFCASVGMSTGDLAESADGWQGITWGLVAAFVEWQLQQGYAIGSINVRLSTVKTYAKLATQAGTIPPAEYALIKTVAGFRGMEGRNIDAGRETTRKGTKKAIANSVGRAQALRLKRLGSPLDQLLICILLDHGLRCGELASLTVGSLDLDAGTMTFYRSKVGKTQTHQLSDDSLRAAFACELEKRERSENLLDLSTREINRRVGELGQEIGIETLSPHDLRHYWATAATRGGTDIKSLQDAGGWSSPAMPLRYVESANVANAGVKLG